MPGVARSTTARPVVLRYDVRPDPYCVLSSPDCRQPHDDVTAPPREPGEAEALIREDPGAPAPSVPEAARL